MNLTDLANIGQVTGAIAVVISLIHVALQILGEEILDRESREAC